MTTEERAEAYLKVQLAQEQRNLADRLAGDVDEASRGRLSDRLAEVKGERGEAR